MAETCLRLAPLLVLITCNGALVLFGLRAGQTVHIDALSGVGHDSNMEGGRCLSGVVNRGGGQRACQSSGFHVRPGPSGKPRGNLCVGQHGLQEGAQIIDDLGE